MRLCRLVGQLRRLPKDYRVPTLMRLYPRPKMMIGDQELILNATEPFPTIIIGWWFYKAPEELADYIISSWEKTLF